MSLLAMMLYAASGAAAGPERLEWALVDVAQQKTYVVQDAADKLAQGGDLDTTPEGSQVRLTVRYEPGKLGTVIKVHLADEAARDRGLVVRLSLSLPAGEAKWWQDPDVALPVAEKPLANTTALRGLPGLPEFPQGERPEYGLYSIYPLGVVEQGGQWWALARPMSQLALVRFIGAGAPEPRLSAEVDLALSEFTTPARQADFTLWFMAGDQQEGPPMRAALARYYALRPEDWQVRAPIFGGWMPFEDLAKIPNVDEFGFAYQEGGGDPGFDDALGALSFVYFHCAGEFANVPGYRRGTEPLPSYEQIIAAFNAVAKQHSGVDNAWDLCGIRGPDGKIDYRPEKTYGDFFCQACVDPALPYGKAMADRLATIVTADKYPKGIDGVYYDGVAAGLDYAPEHLRAANHLLLWDGKLGRPVSYNLWSSVTWAQSIHERLAGTGKLTMLNDSSVTSFPFAGPYIDVPGAEMSITLDRATARHIRSFTHRKPFCTLVKADFSQVSQPLMETYMRRCVAYGILFGFFDISPSGDHPGSSYWEHPEWYNRDRPLFRRYMTLAQELAGAGWQPVPHASASGAYVEAFGEAGNDRLTYLTVSTDPREKPEAKRPVSIAPPVRSAASGPPVEAVELLTGRIEPVGPTGDLATEMTGEDLQVWAFGSPGAQARACLDRARDLIEHRTRLVAAARAGAGLLTPWAPYGGGEAQIVSPGRDSRYCLAVQKDRPGDAGANLTVTVNQTRPRKLLVSAWSRAENVTGPKDQDYALYVDCYYTDGTAIYGQTAPFATGTHDWEYGQRVIEPAKPIRNINVYLLFRGAHTGRVWLDDVQAAWVDEAEHNLVPRGGFEPTEAGSQLAGSSPEAEKISEGFGKLAELLKAAPTAVNWKEADSAVGGVERAAALAQWGADTERTLRDASDLKWDLKLAQACLTGKPQPARRESRLTKLEQLVTQRVSATGPRQYRTMTGKVPPGTIVGVDTNFEGYTPETLTDGKANPQTTDWTRVAWASDEGAGAHWIELRFPQPAPVRQVRVWWALDSGRLHVSKQIEAQVKEDQGWVRAEGQEVKPGDKPGVTVISLPGRPLSALRLYQPPRSGSADRPELMWVTEIEVE